MCSALADSSVSICKFLKRDSVLSLRSHNGYLPSLVHDFGEQFVSPIHMKARDWFWAAGVAGATVVLFKYDYAIDENMRYLKSKNSFVNFTSPIVTEFGSTYGIGVISVCGVYGLFTKNKKLFQTSLLASQAAITSGVWVRVVKYCTSRERPSASYTSAYGKGHRGGYWYGFFKQYDPSITSIGRDVSYFDAFPSGHTSTAFAIATVFAMQYSDTKAVGIVAYSLAGLVGISRMVEHTHWASDVLVGGMAGYLCAKQVVHHHRKIDANESFSSLTKKKKTELFFSMADSFAGVKCRLIF